MSDMAGSFAQVVALLLPLSSTGAGGSLLWIGSSLPVTEILSVLNGGFPCSASNWVRTLSFGSKLLPISESNIEKIFQGIDSSGDMKIDFIEFKVEIALRYNLEI